MLKSGDSDIHVVHICTTFNHRSGGIKRLYKRLRAIRDRGYRVSLIVGRDYVPDPQWDLDGIEVYQIASLVKYIHPQKDLKTLQRMARLLKKLRPQAVHTHLAKAGILGRWAAFQCRIPMILHTVHGPTFPRSLPYYKRLPYLCAEWITSRFTDFFVFVGEELRREYVNRGVCRLKNSTVVQTGNPDADIDALQHRDEKRVGNLRLEFLTQGETFLVVNVGRVVPSKQQDHAIRILHALRSKGVPAHLAIIGEGFLKEEKRYLLTLKNMAEDLGLKEHVSFTGHRSDVLDLMAASDAILHTSQYEGLPNILVEGALAARPVVTYSVCGACEVLEDGRNGYIVPQGDVDLAAEKLAYLAANPEEAEKIGRSANLHISSIYRESAMIKKKLAFYDKIFSEQSDRAG